MPSQADLETFYEYPLYEATIEEGKLKTRNETEDQVQRPVITDRDYNGRYKIQVQLVTCVHGTLDRQTKTPASLIVFEYQLHCLEENHVFSSVYTSLEFSEASSLQPGKQPAAPIRPGIIAYAPFRLPM